MADLGVKHDIEERLDLNRDDAVGNKATVWAEAKDLLEAHAVSGTHLDVCQRVYRIDAICPHRVYILRNTLWHRHTSRPVAKRNSIEQIYLGQPCRRGTADLTAVLWKACLQGWPLAAPGTWILQGHTIPRTIAQSIQIMWFMLRTCFPSGSRKFDVC